MRSADFFMTIFLTSSADGSFVAMTLLLVLVLTGAAVKCFTLIKKPKTSTLCVLALGIFFLSMIVSAITSLVGLKLVPTNPVGPIIAATLAMLSGLLILTSGVLAIVGLAIYRKNGVPYEQGKAQAITTLVLFGIFAISGIATAISGSRDRPNFAVTEDSLEVENEEFNFRIQIPSRRWTSLNPEIHNPEATFIYRRIHPEIWFMMIAEQAGTTAGITTEALTDISKSNMTAQIGKFDIVDQAPVELGGVEFSVFETTAKELEGSNTTLAYRHYVASHQGYCYQMVFFSEFRKKGELFSAATSIANSFEQIEPEKVLSTIGDPVAPMDNREAGFSIDLTDLGWNEYDEIAGTFPEADFAATLGGFQSSGITYLNLEGLNPDMDALRAGFLAAGFGADSNTSFDGSRQIEAGVAQGEAFHFRRKSEEGIFAYRFRLLRNEDHVWFISAWGNADVENVDESMEEVLGRYQIFEPEPSETPPSYSEERTEAMADIFNQIGLSYYWRDNYQQAALFFKRAGSINPGDGQIFENILYALTYANESEEALELLDEKGEPFSSNLNLGVIRAENLNALDKSEAAKNAYAKAFAAGHDNPDDLLDFLNVLVDLDEQEKAIEAVDEFDERHPGNHYRLTRWKSSLLQQLDRYDDSIALLETLIEQQPDYRLRVDLIEANLDSEQYSDALSLISEIEESGTRNGELLFLRGRGQMGLESYRDAKENFEAALKLNPDDELIEDYLEHASTMLGKGSVAEIQDEIEALVLPSEVSAIADRLETEFAAELDSSYGAKVLRSISGRLNDPDKPGKSTFECAVEITDSKGLDQFSTLKFGFDPHVEDIYINEVRIADKNGKTIITADVEDFFIVNDTGDELATTEKVVHVPVPGLKVGQILHYQVTREYYGKTSDLEFISRPLDSNLPTSGRIFYVSGDPKSLTYKTLNGVQKLEFEDGVAFYTENPTPRESENMQPWLQEFAPWLSLSNHEITWEEEGLEYLGRLDSLLSSPSKTTKKLAEEIVGEAQSDEEKIALIAEHVSSSLTYQGIEFGPRGQIPNSVAKILENRYGDCKDHSLLLTQLLRAAGVEAYLALVATQSPIDPDLPTLDQFDHMIAFAPAASAPFIDPTVDHFPHGILPPQTLIFEMALVLDPDNVRLEKIEPPGESGHRFLSERKVEVDEEDGSFLRVEEVLTLSGYPANWYRDYLADLRHPERIEKLTSLIQRYGDPQILELDVAGLSESAAPLVLNMVYSLPRPLSQRRSGKALKPPSVWEQYFVKMPKTIDRTNPFEVLIETEFRSRCVIEAPESFAIEPSSAKHFQLNSDSEFAEWSVATDLSKEGDQLVIESSFFRKTGKHPAEQYSTFVDSVNEGIEVFQQELSLTTVDD